MNMDQIGGIFRALAGPVLTLAAAKGWIASEDTAWIVASISGVATAIWSVWTNRPVRLAK